MKWLTILFALFILIVIALADLGKLGFMQILNQIPFGDKIGHFVLYGILTLLIDLTLIRSRPHLNRRLILFRVALILIPIIGIEEYSQKFFANRTFDLVDLAFSYLGVIAFSWATLKLPQ